MTLAAMASVEILEMTRMMSKVFKLSRKGVVSSGEQEGHEAGVGGM